MRPAVAFVVAALCSAALGAGAAACDGDGGHHHRRHHPHGDDDDGLAVTPLDDAGTDGGEADGAILDGARTPADPQVGTADAGGDADPDAAGDAASP